VTDTERLQKLAAMMVMRFGFRDSGYWLFPTSSVSSERGTCTADDLRAFIDNQSTEQE